jgi:hypothetical protein
MNNRIFKASILLLTLFVSGTVNADSNLGVGVKAGTLGFGFEARWQPVPLVDFRLGTNLYDYTDNRNEAGINYDGDLNLETIYLTGNFHFPISPFRVTAGAFSNGNEVKLVSADNIGFNIGGIDYPAGAVGTLTSKTTFDDIAPYLGIGYDFEMFGKAGFNLDFGVLWQGEPEVTLDATGTSVGNPIFDAALENERQQLEDVMNDLKAWPVVSLGFVYNF